jgi:hypothetical protein
MANARVTWLDDQKSKAEWMAISAQHAREDREAKEAQRKADVEAARTTAQELSAKLMELRNAKFGGEYADANPLWVSDPEIDVMEIRYRAAIRTLEELDRE